MLFTAFLLRNIWILAQLTEISSDFMLDTLLTGFRDCLIELVLFDHRSDVELSSIVQIPLRLNYENRNVTAGSSAPCTAAILWKPSLSPVAEIQQFNSTYRSSFYLLIVQDSSSSPSFGNTLFIPAIVDENKVGVSVATYYVTRREDELRLRFEAYHPCPFGASFSIQQGELERAQLDQLYMDELMRTCEGLLWFLYPFRRSDPSSFFCDRISGRPLQIPYRAPHLAKEDWAARIVLRMVAQGFNRSVVLKSDIVSSGLCISDYIQARRADTFTIIIQDESLSRQRGSGSEAYYYAAVSRETALNFLTCDGVTKYLSFRAYTKPFQFPVWIWLSAVFGLVSAFLAWLLRRRNFGGSAMWRIQGEKWSTTCRISGSAIFLLFRILMEQGSRSSRSMLVRIPGLKLYLASISLTCLVLLNAYRGKVTSDLTLPLPLSRLQSLEDGVRKGFYILPQLHYSIRNNRQIQGLGSVEYVKELITEELNATDFMGTLRAGAGALPRRRALFKQILGRIRVPPNFPNVTFMEVLAECNNTLYVDYDLSLDEEYLALQSQKWIPNLYKGTEPFATATLAWGLRRADWDRTNLVPTRIHASLVSGILQYWENTFSLSRVKKGIEKLKAVHESRRAALVPLDLKSNNIMAVLVAFWAGALFTGFAFLLEFLYSWTQGARSSIVRRLRKKN